MSQFNYTLPSGAAFTMEAPAGTTQAQADYIFYSQVAAGALVGFAPGQSVSGTTSSLAKFELSRLDRGTAGVDDTVILSIINGLPTTASIPSLINTPLTNPVTQANIAAITGTGFTAPAIGSLSSSQVQALMAQVANSVDQPATVMTNEKGVGQYGLSCQQLEMAGYVKPGTWQQFIFDPAPLIDVLGAPGTWTGLGGINTAQDFLNNLHAQNTAQATLMTNGYNSLQAAGVITTPAAQSLSAVVGQVYNGASQALTTATATLTNSVNSQVASLVTNASRFGTELTAQWASGLPNLNSITSNLTSIVGQAGLSGLPSVPSLGDLTSGIAPNIASVQTAMNSLGKVSQFAANAASTLTSSLSNISLSDINLSSLTSNLPNVGALTANLPNVSSLTANLPSLNSLTNNLPNVSVLTAKLPDFSNLDIGSIFGSGGDSLVASVQKAAGFTNTVNRATVDVATTKIFGSAKIPTPSFGADVPGSASIGAALDISQAQNMLQGLQGQATAIAGQVQGQANNLLDQAEKAVGGIPVFNASQVNQILG
jgi:hypothetical protein